jgi:predicted aspartyl protease
VNDTTGLFLVDTGSDCTIIDSAFARRLGLKSSGIALVERNYSKEEEITTTAEKVRIGAKPWSSVPLVLLDLSMLSRVQGAPISGILGTDLLTRITMRLSYSSGVAGIADEIERGSLPVALDKVRGRYFVPVNIGATPVEMLLDSGTNITALSDKGYQLLPVGAELPSKPD